MNKWLTTDENFCQTIGCVAGWACVLSGDSVCLEENDINHNEKVKYLAANWLELNDEYAF